MTTDETKTIELPVECARSLLDWADDGEHGAIPGRLSHAIEQARASLARHEVAQNPLGLPWEDRGSRIVDCRGNRITDGTATRNCVEVRKFVFHAPRVAECLDLVSGLIEPATPNAKWKTSYDHARAVLADAGWHRGTG